MERLDNMSCPKCGKEMKSGYIYSVREILWTKNDKNRIFGFLDENETLVGMPIFKSKKVVAYRCEECKIASFEYETQI